MIKRGLRRKAVALKVAIAGVILLAFAASPSASADTMRVFNLTITCATGLPYGLLINNGSGWYSPDAPHTATWSGTTKSYSVYIPASATSLAYEPTYCDNQPSYNLSQMWEGYTYGISPGTSTINATGYVNDYSYSIGYGYSYLFYYDSISSLTYS